MRDLLRLDCNHKLTASACPYLCLPMFRSPISRSAHIWDQSRRKSFSDANAVWDPQAKTKSHTCRHQTLLHAHIHHTYIRHTMHTLTQAHTTHITHQTTHGHTNITHRHTHTPCTHTPWHQVSDTHTPLTRTHTLTHSHSHTDIKPFCAHRAVSLSMQFASQGAEIPISCMPLMRKQES